MNILKHLINLIFLLLIGTSLFASKQKFPISEIPVELKKNAKAVVRHSEEVFEVHTDNRATHTISYTLSILSKDALNYADLYMPYDKFTRISNITATIYDESGNKIRKIPKADILDYLAFDGFSIYHDNRIKYLDTKYQTVPFTVEFSYTTHYNGLMYYPGWIPVINFDFSVEQAVFKVISPKDNIVRYREQNLPNSVQISNDEDNTTYTWQVNNLKPIKEEPYCLPFIEYAPMVFTAPADFKIDKYPGNMESWENFGKWISELNAEKDTLPDETIQYLNELVKDAATEEEKVERIYSYLQNNTRYVSIQVGIGGWQPFDAETVDRLKYGDCKALANYMKAMLKAVGIHSEYALIRAGKDAPRMMKDFPMSQFNHAFLCVPVINDTIWLECTNPFVPCGYLGTFDDDRDVLLITKNGGKIAHTTIYSANNNLQTYNAKMILDESGNANATMNNSFKGIHYSEMLPLILGDDTDKKRRLYDRITIPNFKITEYEHTQIRERIPTLKETLSLDLESYGAIMGNRIILPLNLINKETLLPSDRNERLSDIFIRRDVLEKDSIVYHIPKGYSIEGLPDNKELNSDFGSYSCRISATDSTITYVRYQRTNKGTYDNSRYQEFYEYIEKIARMDNARAVLIKMNDLVLE